MRIAILSWESQHSMAVGGIASHVTELAAALKRKGHMVHVFTRRAPKQSAHDLIDGVHYHRCLYPPHHDFVDDVNNMCRAFVDRVFEVEDFVGHFDMIHAHDWLSANAMIWIKQGRGHKCILTIHATEYARCGNAFPPGRSSRIRDQERAGTYWADRVIAVSQATKNELMWMYEVPERKISVVYNGVSPSRFEIPTDPGEDKKRYDIAPLDPTVLFCGRLTWQKGPDLLIEAIPSILRFHNRSKFIFLGDGEMKADLEARVRHLGVAHAVRFTGQRNGDELIHLFKLADVICLPSRNEPFGIVVLEAWSACKPVVVTQNGGPSEYVWHEVNGLKIEPKPDLVAWGVCSLFSDFERARWMGRNGRKTAMERFTWDTIVEQTLAVYEEVCPGTTRSAFVHPPGTLRNHKESADKDISGQLPDDAELVEVVNRIDEQCQVRDLLAKLKLKTNSFRCGACHALASYKQSLAQLGIQSRKFNGSLILEGDWETVLAAVKRCHQMMHQKGIGQVACKFELETSLLSSANDRFRRVTGPVGN